MKKFKKLFLTTLLAVTAAPALSACSIEEEDDSPEEGATLIKFYARSFEEWSNAWLSDAVDEFNRIKDDGIQIDMVVLEDDVYSDALATGRENGSQPDIFMTSYGNLYHDVIQHNYGIPLNDLFGQEAIDDILDNVKEMVTFKGQIYGYPQLIEPSSIFYYRKSVLENAGVTKCPETWEELLDACAKVKPTLRKGQYCFGVPTGLALGWATYGQQYNVTGGLAVNEKWDECLVDSDGYRDLAGFWYDLYAGGYCPAGTLTKKGYNDMIEAVCEDKLAMCFCGSWSIAEVAADYDYVLDDIGVAVAPTKTGEKNKITATNGGWTYNISSGLTEEHQQKAATFLKWLLADDAARTAGFFEAACYSKSAPLKSVKEYIEAHANPKYKDFLQIINGVAAISPAEPKFDFSISLAVAGILEKCAVNCDPDKGEAYRTKTINDGIAAAKQTILNVINAQGYQTNPYLD